MLDNVLSALAIAFLIAGVVAMIGGDQLENDTALYAGLTMFGIGFVAAGIEGLVTRRFGFARGIGLRDETYRGAGAAAWGVLFTLVGLWIIAISIVFQMGTEQALIHHLARRPGLLLLSAAAALLGQGVAAVTGTVQLQEGSRWEVLANLAVYRLLPGIILLSLGLGVLGLGLLEVLAPATFDDMGGGFLEVLFGLD